MKIENHITSIPLFGDLPKKNLEDLAAIVVGKVFKRGEIIFSEGDEGNGFYVIISGRVKVYKLSPDGKEQILHIWEMGEPFGEVPVFEGKSFPANAEAIEESRVFFFPRPSFIDLIKKDPSLSLNMLAILSRRLRKFTMLVEDLSLKEVPARLAKHLLYLSEENVESNNLHLDIAKIQLASLLGTIPETLSRILGKMKDSGLIQLDGRRIRILDRKALEEVASSGKLA